MALGRPTRRVDNIKTNLKVSRVAGGLFWLRLGRVEGCFEHDNERRFR